jgi:hypothetical protein
MPHSLILASILMVYHLIANLEATLTENLRPVQR